MDRKRLEELQYWWDGDGAPDDCREAISKILAALLAPDPAPVAPDNARRAAMSFWSPSAAEAKAKRAPAASPAALDIVNALGDSLSKPVHHKAWIENRDRIAELRWLLSGSLTTQDFDGAEVARWRYVEETGVGAKVYDELELVGDMGLYRIRRDVESARVHVLDIAGRQIAYLGETTERDEYRDEAEAMFRTWLKSRGGDDA